MKKKPKKRMNQPGLTKDYKRFPLPYSSCMNGDYYDEFSCPPLIGFPVMRLMVYERKRKGDCNSKKHSILLCLLWVNQKVMIHA